MTTQLRCLNACKITAGALVLILARMHTTMNDEIALETEFLVTEVARVNGVHLIEMMMM
jgi:hypothetical protein